MKNFIVSYTFHARCFEVVRASDLEEARRIVNERVEREDFDLQADEIDDVDFDIRLAHPTGDHP